MPLVALATAQLDHATKERITIIERRLVEARKNAAAASNPQVKQTWEETAHHLNEALGTLRFGPFSDRDPTGQGVNPVVDSKEKGGPARGEGLESEAPAGGTPRRP